MMKLIGTSVGAALICGAGCAQPAVGPDETEIAQQVGTISCGPTDEDAANASALGDVFDGFLTAERMACGRRVVAEVAARGLDSRAAEIAIETVLTESTMLNDTGGDHSSVGLFQQIDAWGTFAERTNPEHATDAFLDHMVNAYPDGAWETVARGVVAQKVQGSAHPDRYETHTDDAIAIVARLWHPDLGWAQLVRADLDGNGDDELGFYTTRDGTFAWYPMAATGLLGTRLSASTIGAGWSAILGVDTDGDHRDELAFYDAKSGGFAVYTSTASGTLGSRRSASTLGTGWTSVIAADFDGDGRDELGFYNKTSGVYSVYRVNSDGTLDTRLSTATLGTGWTELVPLDVTGDGRPELAFYNAASGNFAVYATTTAGALDTRLTATALSDGWSAVEAAQIVPGGRPELVFYNRTTGGLSVYTVDATGALASKLASYSLN